MDARGGGCGVILGASARRGGAALTRAFGAQETPDELFRRATVRLNLDADTLSSARAVYSELAKLRLRPLPSADTQNLQPWRVWAACALFIASAGVHPSSTRKLGEWNGVRLTQLLSVTDVRCVAPRSQLPAPALIPRPLSIGVFLEHASLYVSKLPLRASLDTALLELKASFVIVSLVHAKFEALWAACCRVRDAVPPRSAPALNADGIEVLKCATWHLYLLLKGADGALGGARPRALTRTRTQRASTALART